MNHLNKMLELAKQARDKAYAPYSKFYVGACIKTKTGNYYIGCNVENAAYGLTQCAEGSAISNMIINDEKSIAEILVVGYSKTLLSPCGACRQKIREFADANTLVHMCVDQIEKTVTLAELLPESFGPESLL